MEEIPIEPTRGQFRRFREHVATDYSWPQNE
jgi:hypothetical protein